MSENEKIKNILENAKGNSLDIYYTLYQEYMAQSENPSELLCQILQYPLRIGTQEDKDSLNVSKEKAEDIIGTYCGLLRETVRVIMRKNGNLQEFYRELYDCVFSDTADLFPSDPESRAVLIMLLVEQISEIPYFQAEDPLKMADEEYRRTIENIRPCILQAVHMMNRHFKSRTEETSQLLKISQQLNNDSDKVVYWSVLISLIQANSSKQVQ